MASKLAANGDFIFFNQQKLPNLTLRLTRVDNAVYLEARQIIPFIINQFGYLLLVIMWLGCPTNEILESIREYFNKNITIRNELKRNFLRIGGRSSSLANKMKVF